MQIILFSRYIQREKIRCLPIQARSGLLTGKDVELNNQSTTFTPRANSLPSAVARAAAEVTGLENSAKIPPSMT